MNQSSHYPAQVRPANSTNRGLISRPPGQQPQHRITGVNNASSGQNQRPQQIQQQQRPSGQNSPHNQVRPQGHSGQARPNPNNNAQRPSQQGNGPNQPP
jgi:hypothetical protein